MGILKTILAVLGVLMILMGLLWVGQGLNIIKWPASSFMIGVPTWSWRGLILAALGAGLVVFSRRR
jgi:hypothetical protein